MYLAPSSIFSDRDNDYRGPVSPTRDQLADELRDTLLHRDSLLEQLDIARGQVAAKEVDLGNLKQALEIAKGELRQELEKAGEEGQELAAARTKNIDRLINSLKEKNLKELDRNYEKLKTATSALKCSKHKHATVDSPDKDCGSLKYVRKIYDTLAFSSEELLDPSRQNWTQIVQFGKSIEAFHEKYTHAEIQDLSYILSKASHDELNKLTDINSNLDEWIKSGEGSFRSYLESAHSTRLAFSDNQEAKEKIHKYFACLTEKNHSNEPLNQYILAIGNSCKVLPVLVSSIEHCQSNIKELDSLIGELHEHGSA